MGDHQLTMGCGATEEDAPTTYPPTGLAPAVQKLPEWIQLGCGDAAYDCAEKNATFAVDGKTPAEMPDLSKHSNYMAEVLVAKPEIYETLKDKTTSSGVTLAQCIKTGVDNPGHPHIKTVGMTACDEESYEVFKELFDQVISARHGGDDHMSNEQPTNMDLTKLSDTDIDPEGKYVLTTRVRTGRSVRGFKLPPAIGFQERRDLEKLCVDALLNMTGDLAGDYFPLRGSRSYKPKPGGMSEAMEEGLRNAGNLFQEPDSTLLLSSGCGRHWPDARGIFKNEAENFFVWVNEEDQMRIVSMEKGDNIHAIFNRFANATKAVQESLEADGYGIMHNDHLGYILTCPSNLGTGLRAGAMVKVPLFSARKDFRDLMGKMGLQARGTAGVDSASTGGTWDISNADRLGKSETALVNIFIEGLAQFIRWEMALEKGLNIDKEVAARCK